MTEQDATETAGSVAGALVLLAGGISALLTVVFVLGVVLAAL